jgi:hypothetical protein
MSNFTSLFKKETLFSALIFAAFCISITNCSKDRLQENLSFNKGYPVNNEKVLPAPEFTTSDSIIILKENETTFTIKIFANDTLNYYYTADGSAPDKNKTKYDPAKGILAGIGNYNIKIIAFSKLYSSSVTVKKFSISNISPVTVSGIKNKTTYQNSVVITISNIDASLQYTAKLNDSSVNISSPFTVSQPNFYSLKITSKLGNEQRTDTFLFVIEDPAMFDTEWGLKTWVPKPFTINKITTESVETIYPKNFSIGLNLPVIIKTTDGGTIKPLYFPTTNSLNSKSYNVKRGIGSMNLLLSSSVTSIDLSCSGNNSSLPITCENTTWTSLSGTLTNRNIGKNARVHVDGNLTIPTGDTLQIEEGSIIAIDEAIDINNNGCIKISGTLENPVVITCYKPDGFWGGFLSKGIGNSMEISNAIICQSGYHTSSDYQWGHAKRQALFYLDGTAFKISNSYLVDQIGQVFYSTNATLQIDNILVQRAKTGGQLNTSTVTIDHSIFTDFPDDSYTFRDEDNDAIYLDYCDATIKNSTFMFTKDDGIDSGGGEGGTVNVDNCWFEATFHEGLALSSNNPTVKNHNISNCTVTNCEQGIELGYSSPNHVVNVDNCNIYKNSIGLRYGDNYEWSVVEGSIHISNTRSVNNFDYDVWNMVRSQWSGKLNNMTFSNVTISKPSEQYPGLTSSPTGIIRLSF